MPLSKSIKLNFFLVPMFSLNLGSLFWPCQHAQMQLTDFFLIPQGESRFVCGQPDCNAEWSHEEVCKMALLTPEEIKYFEKKMLSSTVMNYLEVSDVSASRGKSWTQHRRQGCEECGILAVPQPKPIQKGAYWWCMMALRVKTFPVLAAGWSSVLRAWGSLQTVLHLLMLVHWCSSRTTL